MQFRAAIIMERRSAPVKDRSKTSLLCHNSVRAKIRAGPSDQTAPNRRRRSMSKPRGCRAG
jgi:hypothetical protein